MTITRHIKVGPDRRPNGNYTFIATFRDGTQIIEFEMTRDEKGNETVLPQVSFDRVTERTSEHGGLCEVALIPFFPGFAHIRIAVAPGEYVKKVWTVTKDLDLDTEAETERPVIDAFVLVSEKSVHHYVYNDGSMVISTHPEP